MPDLRSSRKRKTFKLFLIQPSRYDDDGYVIQWARVAIPSGSLGILHGLALDCVERRVLGDDVEIQVTPLDENATRIKPKKIIREIQAAGGQGLVALVSVQTNQFPRAVDIARPLLAVGIPVCIGGFHVSGCLAMLPKVPPDIQEAIDLGIYIFAGEAEGRLEGVLQDAYRGELKPVYNFMSELPDLQGAPTPILPAATIRGYINSRASFDTGRGCPFQCSFCTIINVQGRKSRYRSADDVERIVRANHAQGVTWFFLTDDNLARNRNWEAIFDRFIKLRRDDNIEVDLSIQADVLCHKIPNFIEKAALAGVKTVFIGLESINPDALQAAKKKQNQIIEYRPMLQAWKSVGVINYCGYILGFPNDTPESIARDVEILKRELPVDLVSFNCLTPLPGSEDHKALHAKDVWMDPDMNKYDLDHVTTDHPRMSKEEYRRAHEQAWHSHLTPEHVETIMRRAAACGMSLSRFKNVVLWFRGWPVIEGVHPYQSGLFRRKYRKVRRYGMPLESPLVFYPRYLWEIISKSARLFWLAYRYDRIRRRVENDPMKLAYRDIAMTLPSDEELDTLEIFSATDATKTEIDKVRQSQARRAAPVVAE